MSNLVNDYNHQTNLNLVVSILEWFKKAKPTPTDKDVCVQLSCHLEEIAEMLHEINNEDLQINLEEEAEYLKDKKGAKQVAIKDKVEFLDSLCDQIVTALGTGYMAGFDMEGALAEVVRSNWSKFENGNPVFDSNGKIKKGNNYSKPDLSRFVD